MRTTIDKMISTNLELSARIILGIIAAAIFIVGLWAWTARGKERAQISRTETLGRQTERGNYRGRERPVSGEVGSVGGAV